MTHSLSHRQQKILNVATEQARNSTMNFRHGSVLVIGPKHFCVGSNNGRDYINGQQVGSCHAEIDVLHKFLRTFRRKRMPRMELWVVRVNKDGNLKDSRPCQSCMKTIFNYGLRRIWYSDSNGCIQHVNIRGDCIETYTTNFQQAFKTRSGVRLN